VCTTAAYGNAIKVPALWHQLDNWKLTLKNPARQRARTRRRASRTVFAVKIEPHMNATKQFSEKMFGAL
jgi:hypothetical protein